MTVLNTQVQMMTEDPVWRLQCHQVSQEERDSTWRLADGRRVKQAVSCLVTPKVGDHVLVAESNGTDQSGAECFIVHILQRESCETVQLTVPGATQVQWQQGQIALLAKTKLTLFAAQQVDLGSLEQLLIQGKHQVYTAWETAVSHVQDFVQQVDSYTLTAKHLLKMHGEYQLLTAEKEIKVDADRITMG
ncbi:DUF3540 domain-containing protein [Zooshikella harenae]|uniref:DUF3540 domain-containing protein n=1 Tax=Zooshikella harenae TaxID=2827238 RepID=A0ABS5ZBF1_9GAMM|nr:DUF3540 domain-containing protein [Zooshikella harenae]MBU2711208.1 DUF3540 domain-containing protein [Zooshikella harenae]